MPFQPPVITRRETFTVAGNAVKDQYGNLQVHDTNGNEYKISAKRANLFELFQPGNVVEVGYAVYQEREYIAIAHLAGAQSTPAPQQPVAVKDTPQASKASTKPCESSKDRTVVLSYAKDLVVAGKVELGDLLNKADWLLSWLRSD